jgi:hypothetical protein
MIYSYPQYAPAPLSASANALTLIATRHDSAEARFDTRFSLLAATGLPRKAHSAQSACPRSRAKQVRC